MDNMEIILQDLVEKNILTYSYITNENFFGKILDNLNMSLKADPLNLNLILNQLVDNLSITLTKLSDENGDNLFKVIISSSLKIIYNFNQNHLDVIKSYRVENYNLCSLIH
jgi:hypothetical protein